MVKITDLTTHTNPALTDVLPIVDVSADVTKKVSVGEVIGKISGDVDVAIDGTSSIDTGVIADVANAEVQRVFALVEGTASVLLSAPATLTAGSTGPLTVSVADATYLTDGTSITGVLGTVYGTLSRSGSTYSFESVQSYTSNVTFATGTRFAAAFLNDTFNPLRVGEAELQEDLSFAQSGYVYSMLDAAGRIAWGVKADGSIVISKVGSVDGTFSGTFTGDFTGDVDADEIRVNRLTAPGGTIDLDSVDVTLLNILGGGAQSGDLGLQEQYSHVLLDSADRIAYGVRPDGTVYFPKTISGTVEYTSKLRAVTGEEVSGDDLGYAAVEVDDQDRITQLTELDGTKVFPKCRIDAATIKELNVETINNQQQAEQLTVDDAASVIVQWGDSMTEDMVATTLATKLEAISGRSRTVLNRGAGGQKRDQVMGRQGSKDIAVTLAGNEIPASTTITASASVNEGLTGPIALSLADAEYLPIDTTVYAALGEYRGQLTRSSGGSYSLILTVPASEVLFFPTGMGISKAVAATAVPDVISHKNYDTFCHLNGVRGVLDHTFTDPKVFQRLDHGAAVPVAAGTVPVVNPTAKINGSTMFLHTGTTIIVPSINSSYAESVTEDGSGNIIATPELDDTLTMVAKLRNPFDRYLILSIHNGRQHAKPSSLYYQDQTRIRLMRETFGDRFYDLRSDLIAGAKEWFQANYPTEYAQTWFKTYIDIGSGTAFPASPRDGDIFTRTDEDQKYIYDGTAATPGWVATTQRVKASTGQNDAAGGVNGSDWDIVAGDTVPRALRRDDIHANSFGKEFICELLAAKLYSLGW